MQLHKSVKSFILKVTSETVMSYMCSRSDLSQLIRELN